MAERKVLIIDDDDALRRMLRQAFQRYKFRVLIADTGAEGLELARKEVPDLVLLSVELSDGNGFLVCKDFKTDKGLKSVPVIITSRKATEADFEKHRKLKVRADDYLHKPFTDEELFHKVGNVVGFSLSADEYTELETKVHDFLEERTKLEAEISDKADRIAQLEAELKRETKDRRKLADEVEELKVRLADSKASAGAAREESARAGKLESELAEAAKNRERLAGEVERLEAELKAARADADKAEKASSKEKASLKEVVEKLREELENAEDERVRAEARASGELEAVNAKVESEREKRKAGEAEVAELRSQLDEAQERGNRLAAELEDVRASIAGVEKDLDVSFDKLAAVASGWRDRAAQADALESQVETLTGTVNELNERIESLEKEKEFLGQELDGLREQAALLVTVRDELAGVQAERDGLTEKVDRLTADFEDVRRTLDRETKRRTKLKEVLEKALTTLEEGFSPLPWGRAG